MKKSKVKDPFSKVMLNSFEIFYFTWNIFKMQKKKSYMNNNIEI